MNNDNNWYPEKLKVSPEGTPKTYNFIKESFNSSDAFHYAEFGIYKGATVENVIKAFPNVVCHLFDFEETLVKAQKTLKGFVYYYPNTQKFNDSYNWSLMKIIEKRDTPLFDYVFLDGAHTVAVDALTFFLADKLLKIGGYMDFDDYSWRLRGSSLDPIKVPIISEQYTDEQIDARQVAMIVDLLVKTNPNYEEVVKNKIYKKIA